ncbi:MAG: HlyD family secretion protein [Gemmataceae bacterium]|nr:HlyD family secretion protein [Gemmataceae bacterium]MDW8266117.1 HlyD family secretion protein [Gemmataceae bacterium]
MTSSWVPPKATYHLRVFAISLALIVGGLMVLLFGVSLEAVVPAHGVISAQDLCELRAPLAGLIELGWFEGTIERPVGESLRVRLDGHGNGLIEPHAAAWRNVWHNQLDDDGQRLAVRDTRFHRLEPGDELWPGQVIGWIRSDELQHRLGAVEDQIRELESQGTTKVSLVRERDRLRELLGRAVLHVPNQREAWMCVEVPVRSGQAVDPGDLIATVVPIDPSSRQPLDLVADLAVEERHWGDVRPGQTVRIFSNVFNHRIHGIVEGRVQRLDPWGRPADDGTDEEREFRARALIGAAPFALPLGSTVKAEIVVGPKPVYRIILEH